VHLAKLQRAFRKTASLSRVRIWNRTGRLTAEGDDAIAEYVANNFVPLRAPLILISQVQRSGGSLLSQLLDGHPQLAAYPHELKIGFPTGEHWIRKPRSARKSFSEMFKKPQFRLVREGFSKGNQDTVRYPFFVAASAQEKIFLKTWPP
jgi:hypothetical protein